MAERLPFGQLTPAARPIGAFIAPAREDTAGPAKPQYATSDIRINTIQRASEGNVQGFNQAQQLAEAIAPFNRALTSLLTEGAVALKKNAIEDGYYDEIRNQQARATLSLQMQQEAGAANAAGQITQLEKVDPPGAALLREANPWKAIGRRRALAQLAGGDVDNVLAADLQMNQGELATVQPGSGVLAQRKTALTQIVLDRYGLTGSEPEAAFYVAPKVNQAWDKYTTQQQKLYNETLRINGRAQATAALGQTLQQMGENGIPLATGEVVPMGDPRFAQLAGQVLTAQLDRSLSFSGGQDRADDLKEIRTQLLGTYGQVPVLADALGFIQGGNPGDANRPTWGASYGLEILETRNRGNAARQQQYELGQKGIEQQLDGLWWAEGSPGSMLPTDPNYAAALINFRNKAAAAGYRDIDSYLKGRMDSQEAVVGRAYAPDPLASQDFLTTIQDLPRSAMNTPEAVQALREQARQAARAEPTPELQAAKYKEYLAAITAKQKQAAETTPGLQSAIDKALLQDLGLPQVKPLVDAAKAKAGGGDAFASLLQGGAGAMAAASGLGNDKITAFTQRLNNLFLRNAEAKIDAWMAERPGVPLTSSARNVLISEAIAETRKSEEYKQAFSALTGKNPGEVGPKKVGPGPSQGTAPGPDVRGVARTAAAALPDTTVKGFAVRPVMNGDWLHSELSALSKGKPVSGDLYRLANRAGTTTNRYLLEQLRFYPQLDPNGDARKFLEQKIRQQRQGQTVSGANWQSMTRGTGMGMVPTGYNPLAPGSWLMNMLMPPAAAGTMPTSFTAAYTGGGGGGYVATTGFGYSADRQTQTLHGIQGKPGYDKNHGVGNDHVHHGAADPQTALALAKYLKAQGFPITEFKPWTRVGGHQDPGHYDGRSFDIPVATKDHPRVLAAINAFYAGRGRGGSSGGVAGNPAGYLKRLAYLESRIRNIPNAEGSAGRGYFQAFPAFSSEAIAASGGIDPRDGDYNRSAKATWAWIEKHRPAAAAAIKRGDYATADRILTPTWPSLPGGSQAQPDHVQREARRYLGGR